MRRCWLADGFAIRFQSYVSSEAVVVVVAVVVMVMVTVPFDLRQPLYSSSEHCGGSGRLLDPQESLH